VQVLIQNAPAKYILLLAGNAIWCLKCALSYIHGYCLIFVFLLFFFFVRFKGLHSLQIL